jgi:hypothetical protein
MPTVTSVTKHFPSAKEGFTTTLSSSISSGAATVPLNSVTGYTNGDTVVMIVDPSDVTKKQAFTGVVDTAGIQITGVVWTEGTNTAHSLGATVVDYVAATHMAMVTKGLLVEHNQSGVHAAINPTGIATFATHIDVNDSSTSIRDSSDNEFIKFSKTATAVNEYTVQNAATGNAPQLQATGGDSNINAAIVPKGTGAVTNGTQKIDWWQEIGRTTLGSNGDTISVTSLPARKYLKIIVDVRDTGGTINPLLRFNNDSGANYSFNYNDNGGVNANAVGQTVIGMDVGAPAAYPFHCIVEVENITAVEKVCSFRSIGRGTAGGGNVTVHRIGSAKWANTAAQISRVDIINTGAGDYLTGSEVVVLGHD